LGDEQFAEQVLARVTMMMAACRTPSPMAPRRETQRKPTTRTISVIVLVVMVVCPEAGAEFSRG